MSDEVITPAGFGGATWGELVRRVERIEAVVFPAPDPTEDIVERLVRQVDELSQDRIDRNARIRDLEAERDQRIEGLEAERDKLRTLRREAEAERDEAQARGFKDGLRAMEHPYRIAAANAEAERDTAQARADELQRIVDRVDAALHDEA